MTVLQQPLPAPTPGTCGTSGISRTCETVAPAPWWADAVIYEVYVRSFADGDGDGVGDLLGLTAHLDHLADLGVDAVWVTPIYPSPGHDHGYDVSDLTDVDPRLGGLDAFDELVDAVHARGMRLVLDVVPNHTSDQHPWFRAALADPTGPYRDYYLWRDPAPDGGPPNNWVANFGGPAWTLDPASGQYWYHAYLPEQPDLNWRNPAVVAQWAGVLRFWLARGVDGFRIDVAHNLLKHGEYPDNPVLTDAGDRPTPVGRVAEARRLQRLHDVDHEATPGLFRTLRGLLPPTTAGEPAFLLGETVLDDPVRVARYIGGDRLDAALWFGAESVTFEAADLARVLAPGTTPVPDAGRYAWFLSNHDRSRPASRLAPDGDVEAGADRALAAAAALLLMPGPYLLYQGEELGAGDTDVPAGLAQDPIAVRSGAGALGRDRARTPMPWTAAPGRGFSPARPWLPQGPLPPHGAAADQAGVAASHLERWRSLLAVWRARRASLPATAWSGHDGDLVLVARGPMVAAVNTGTVPRRLAEPGLIPLWRSGPASEGAGDGDPQDDVVRAGEAVWWLAAERSATR